MIVEIRYGAMQRNPSDLLRGANEALLPSKEKLVVSSSEVS